MEEIVALVLIFGGGTIVALAMSPIGRAVADRIRGHTAVGGAAELRQLRERHEDVLAELESVRRDLGELHERVDFTERLLARKRDESALPPASPQDRPVQP